MLEPGQVVDRYAVDAVIGDGGMARVYRVRHTTLGSMHALKVLELDSPGLARRLLEEGRTQATLRHPNVVAVTDVVDVGGAPGIVMELVDGGTLADWLATGPSRAQRLDVFLAICDGVAAAHARGWVHRDLKPANVLMDRSTDPPTPRVADFGLVKALHPDGSRPGTRAGAIMGTPGFMAPEQAVDASVVDARADVFSLGCLLVRVRRPGPLRRRDRARSARRPGGGSVPGVADDGPARGPGR